MSHSKRTDKLMEEGMKKRRQIPSFWWDYDPAGGPRVVVETSMVCLLYTSDAADE